MNKNAISKLRSPTILLVSNDRNLLSSDSLIISSLNQVCISILEATQIITWIQQHQPDLIILDLGWSEIINLQLITALRLDWLTRNIPIAIITNSGNQPFCSLATLDYDACLIKPFTTQELEQTICSLISTPACKYNSKLV